ncbi:hypothetical protein F5Y19DRAFT_471601 [Xylariaceae sp. FL1651]|nr:hypothetical protein F5Y19DRAFT_471601 [Xylariaceae sp. FL1651]
MSEDAVVDFLPEMLAKLGCHPNIVAIKLMCGGIAKMLRIKAWCDPSEFAAIAGQSNWLVPAMSAGSIGNVSEVDNLFPNLRSATYTTKLDYTNGHFQACIQIYDLYNRGKLGEESAV